MPIIHGKNTFSTTEEFLETLGDREKEFSKLEKSLKRNCHDFHEHIKQKRTERTASKHSQVIYLFIDFLSWDTEVTKYEDITRGIANSKFRSWYQRKVGDRTETELKSSIKMFFKFLDTEKKITCPEVLKSFSN